MRNAALIALLLIALATPYGHAEGKITVDPNAAGVSRPAQAPETDKDPRLEQKITCRVKLRPIADLTDDLAKLTGVTFYAGSGKWDWRVREDCATVMAKEVPLSEIMASIARVMKFRWSKGGKAPNWTYRLVEDRSITADIERRVAAQKQQDNERRQRLWDTMSGASRMSPEQLAGIKESDPMIYLFAKGGVLAPTVQFLDSVPALKNAWLAADDAQVSAAWLSPGAKQAWQQAAVATAQLMRRLGEEDMIPDRSPLGVLDRSAVLSISESCVTAEPSWFVIPLPEKSTSELNALHGKALVRAYEENRSYNTVTDEMRPEFAEARKKPRTAPLRYTPNEQLLDHKDDPILKEPLKGKIEAKTVTGLMASLADVTGYAVVTDNFRGTTNKTFEKDTPLGKPLTFISKWPGSWHNWSRAGQVIEIWDTNWYQGRQARVPKTWLEALRRKLKTTGTLEIDDLADIAQLTNSQFYRNFSRDEVLRCVADSLGSAREPLCLYAALNSDQRSVLMSPAGLPFAALTPQQQESALKLILGTSVPALETSDIAKLGARVVCTREAHARQIMYAFTAVTKAGPFPGRLRFATPLYEEPPKPPDDAAAQRNAPPSQ